jgi:hypothetical protein
MITDAVINRWNLSDYRAWVLNEQRVYELMHFEYHFSVSCIVISVCDSSQTPFYAATSQFCVLYPVPIPSSLFVLTS